jgi:hypothetical protein
MRTLVVYASERKAVREMCENFATQDVDVVELEPRYPASNPMDIATDAYRALTGRGKRMKPLTFDWSQYRNIIIVSSLVCSAPSPVLNEFLNRCEFGGRDVSCICVNRTNSFGTAGAKLRKRVRLANGRCTGMLFLPEKQLTGSQVPVTVNELGQLDSVTA